MPHCSERVASGFGYCVRGVARGWNACCCIEAQPVLGLPWGSVGWNGVAVLLVVLAFAGDTTSGCDQPVPAMLVAAVVCVGMNAAYLWVLWHELDDAMRNGEAHAERVLQQAGSRCWFCDRLVAFLIMLPGFVGIALSMRYVGSEGVCHAAAVKSLVAHALAFVYCCLPLNVYRAYRTSIVTEILSRRGQDRPAAEAL
ncbi:hypothetical protein DIPPA_23216 [Diplonema papillatum]|nr:hypothetical protein DIPPA_23216 [Diplonema papillatum]|eukprot:gene2621-4069_t